MNSRDDYRLCDLGPPTLAQGRVAWWQSSVSIHFDGWNADQRRLLSQGRLNSALENHTSTILEGSIL